MKSPQSEALGAFFIRAVKFARHPCWLDSEVSGWIQAAQYPVTAGAGDLRAVA